LSIVLALAALVAVYAATRAVQFFTQPTEAHAEQVPRGHWAGWARRTGRSQSALPSCDRSGHCCGGRAHRGGRCHGAIEAAAHEAALV